MSIHNIKNFFTALKEKIRKAALRQQALREARYLVRIHEMEVVVYAYIQDLEAKVRSQGKQIKALTLAEQYARLAAVDAELDLREFEMGNSCVEVAIRRAWRPGVSR